MNRIRLLAYAIDGTLTPIDRVADQKPYYSGKHRRHGVNMQVIADPAGRLIWASAALPGSVHDLTAARTHTNIDALTSANVMTFADKAYQGARGSIRTPFKRHRYRPKLSAWQKKVNRAHAKIRAIGDRANATLKTLESPDPAVLQPAPGYPHRAGHPRPTSRREPDPPRMKKAVANHSAIKAGKLMSRTKTHADGVSQCLLFVRGQTPLEQPLQGLFRRKASQRRQRIDRLVAPSEALPVRVDVWVRPQNRVGPVPRRFHLSWGESEPGDRLGQGPRGDSLRLFLEATAERVGRVTPQQLLEVADVQRPFGQD